MKTCAVLLVIFVVLLGWGNLQSRNRNRFVYVDLAAAKKATADPCGKDHFRWVKPPVPIEGESRSVLILLGQDATHDARRLQFKAVEVAPGEVALRVFVDNGSPRGPFEYGWIANGTKACAAGLSKEIQAYTTQGNKQRPLWPIPHGKRVLF